MQTQIIKVDPQILGGTPIFAGTRVPLSSLFDYLEEGETMEEFLEDFPSVKKEQVVKLLEISKGLLLKSSQLLYKNPAG